MTLRLVEATVPDEELEHALELLREARIVDVWASGSNGTTGQVRILLDAQDTEAVSDLLVQRFGMRDDFRLVLLSVEATLPAPVERTDSDSDAKVASASGGKATAEVPHRISREELYEDLSQAGRLTRLYVVMVALSTVVAAVGLIRGDVAIIIGAMVIAPLLGPNVALSLACTLGDWVLARRSLQAIGAGVTTAAVLSFLFGVVLPIDPSAPELAGRTGAGVGDIVLALAAGAAGSLAFTTGVPAVVVGVMVAVALLPPLVAAGLLAGAGYGSHALGALTLSITNMVCINLAAVLAFLLQKVRPRTWWEAKRAKKATRWAVTTWIVMILVLLGLMLFGQIAPGVAHGAGRDATLVMS